MLDALKTPSGAYNLTLIISGIIWLLSGIGIFAGFNVNRVKAIEAQQKTQNAEDAKKTADSMRQAAEKRLADTEAELQTTKAKTAELALRLAPRMLTDEQRAGFLHFATNAPKGRVALQSAAGNQEALSYATAIKDLLTKAGFDVANDIRMFMATSPRTTSLTMKVKTINPPAHAGVIHKGFESIGITIPCSVAQPGDEIADGTPIVYVENKP